MSIVKEKVEKNYHESIKKRLEEDYPGFYTIIPIELYDRVRSIITTYDIPTGQELEIFELVANLDESEASEWLDGLQKILEEESETF